MKIVFIDNSENILKALDSFTDNLEEMKKAIREKNSDKLSKTELQQLDSLQKSLQKFSCN